ncbi:MAG TPA: nucleoside-diphosphate sugar epimerase/dehydratase, partial [Bacteroidia bacterium]|nr:nucleoside-diphosphate sugar epimerase/dehydratase [Bacteroidia bacterium]
MLKLNEGYTPRWIVLLIDLFIVAAGISMAYLLRFDFSVPQHEIAAFPVVYSVMIGVRLLSFLIARIPWAIVRYMSQRDAIRILIAISAGTILFYITNQVTHRFITGTYIIPHSIILIEFLATTFGMVSARLIYKAFWTEMKNPSREKRSVIIFGAGESGLITKRTLDRDAGTKYRVLAFIDDDKAKHGRKLEGVTIYGEEKLPELLKKNDVAQVIISVQQISPLRKQEIVDLCLANNARVLNVPPVSTWIRGELSFRQIRKVRIEELLEREPIRLDEDNIGKQLRGKTILVTGAAGSIGSEMVRQIAKFSPGLLVLLDNAESPLHEMELELSDTMKGLKYEIVIGDVRNRERMENVFRTFHPQIVYHAAAYKHVPMMENNPSESILTNVCGTKNVADLSVQYNAEKFVLVSTDKAVNPTNVMGASKRIAEIYVQSLNNSTGGTRFITTRFGNVLGSQGSVIPRFRQQIENGGPVTITDPEITRYFMTIPEACRLVLEAGCMGKGGEIYIFDMGKSVKIIDLAKKMIQLSGLTLGKDIEIVTTGLRPGEKLYEELLNNKENTLPTHHEKIMIAKVRSYDFAEVSKNVEELIGMFDSQDNMKIVALMKKMVPEYVSNNSVFEKLDSLKK